MLCVSVKLVLRGFVTAFITLLKDVAGRRTEEKGLMLRVLLEYFPQSTLFQGRETV